MKSIPYRHKEIQLLLNLSRSDLDPRTLEMIRQQIRELPDWSYLLDFSRRYKLAPLVFDNLTTYFAKEVDPPILIQFRNILERYILSNLFLTHSMLELVAFFKGKGILLVPFKGPVLAHLAYQKPSHRYFLDLDFITFPYDFDRASQEFLNIGLIANYLNDPAYYRQSQFAANPTKMIVDLHYALTPVDCFIQVQTEALLSQLQSIQINAIAVETFSAEETLIILCVDAAKGYWRSIIRLVDIAELLRNQTLDWDIVLSRARSLNCLKVLELGLYLTQRILNAPIPSTIQTQVSYAVKDVVDDDTLYRQIFKLEVTLDASLRWHRFNMQALDSLTNHLRYLYRLGKFSMRHIPALKERIRT